MLTKINARDWTFEISDGAEIPVLTEIAGINTMTIGKSTEEKETTDFDSDGQRESEPIQRHRTFQLGGDVLEDSVTGEREPGQKILEDVSELLGAAAIRELVVTTPGGTTFTQNVWVEPGDQSGGTNDGTTFTYTLIRSGSTVKGTVA